MSETVASSARMSPVSGLGDIKIGLLLPSREVALWGGDNPSLLLEAARAAEEAGFDSVWVGDSLLARPRPEPLAMLGALAASTRHVTLGTAILLPLLRHPVALAHSLATIDRLAAGRLVVGVGPGAEVAGTHAELQAVGVDGHRRVAALLEHLARCRQTWIGDSEPHVSPVPTRPQGPPLWLGAHGPRLLRVTGEQFDGWLPFTPSTDAYALGLRAVRESAERAGRDPDSVTPAVYLTVAVDDDDHEATNALDNYMLAYYGLPAAVMSKVQACHAGSLETTVQWISRYIDVGARHIILRMAHPSLDGYEDRIGAVASAIRPAALRVANAL